jgi:SPP1 gp7 family putative phage head morphogenesis protein
MSRAQSNLEKMFAPVRGFVSSLASWGDNPASNPTQTVDPATNPNGQPPATDTAPVDPPQMPGDTTTVGPIVDEQFGVSQESYFTRFELTQYSPDELITKKGFKIFEKMYQDDQIHLAITALKLMRLSSGVEINEASQDPKDIEIADFVADVLLKIEGGLNDTLFNMMGALEMGWSINEKNWRHFKTGPYGPSGEYPTGMLRLTKLQSLNPQWYNPAVDDFNTITGIVAISPPAFGRKWPADKFLIYSFMKRYENVFGMARTRSLYNWWWIKQVTQRAMGVFIEKYGHPVAVGKYPITMGVNERAALLNALRQLKITSAITMPDGATVDFLEIMTKGSVENFLKVIEKCDQQIVKVIMGQTMSTGTSSAHSSGAGGGAGGSSGASSGSKGGQMAMDVLDMYLTYIGNHLSEGPMAALIKEIVDFNFSGVYNYPTFKFKSLKEEDLSNNITIWIQAASAMIGGTPDGPPDADGNPGKTGLPGKGLVTPQPEDEEFIREVLGFPSVQGKNPLRPNRYINQPKPIQPTPRRPDPLGIPWGGYRPPTPAGPGLPSNYAESKKFQLARKLTKYEGKVDFAESWRILDTDGEDKITKDLGIVVKKAVDKMMKSAEKIGGDTSKIKKLELPYRQEIVSTLREGLLKVAKDAHKQASAELKHSKAKKFADLGGMEPDDVLEYINNKSFTIGNDVSDAVLKRAKQAMYAGVKKGESYKDIVYRVEEAIAPYVDVASDDELSGPHLATAVRTAVAEAYNESRKAAFQDPDLEGFVVAYQYSSVLDGRTTDWCQSEEEDGMDGRIFKVSNPIWDDWTPPVWYNCRSVLVPITKVDDWDGEESAEPTIMPPAGFN